MAISISQLKDHYISLDKDRHATAVVEKYTETATIKGYPKFRRTALNHDIIFTK